jgi:hypothetical protein
MSEEEFPDQSPGDKAFGQAAAEKAEALDEAGSVADLPPEGSGEAPRAGGKAEPE